jgi:putative transposase
VSEAKRLKALEDENARLKKLLAEAMLDNAILKDVASKKGDARGSAGGRGGRPCAARRQQAADVPSVDRGSLVDPVSVPAVG